MRIFSVFFACLAVVSLAGCNGEEDFSDAVLNSELIGLLESSSNSGFTADSKAKIGNLITPVVTNIKYRCGGYTGVIGQTGNEEDDAAFRYRCPVDSASIQFFIGDERNQIRLGRAWFRQASNIDEDLLQISPLDLFTNPARIDADSLAADKVINMAALLRALDSDTNTPDIIEIADAAHCVIAQGDFPASETTPHYDARFEDNNYAEFQTLFNPFLNDVATQTDADCLPGDVQNAFAETATEVRDALKDGARRAMAGLYFFDAADGYGGTSVGFLQEYYRGTGRNLFSTSGFFPGALVQPENASQRPLDLPTVMTDRAGRVWGGGPYWSSRVITDASSATLPDGNYMALAAGAEFSSDSRMVNFTWEGNADGTSVDMFGRLFGPLFFPDQSNPSPDTQFNFQNAYSDITYPSNDYAPLQEDDFAYVTGTMMYDKFVPEQIYIGIKSSSVSPYLNQTKMDALFGNGKRYSFAFFRSNGPGENEAPEDFELVFDQPRGTDPLEVVINNQGEVFIDTNDDCAVDGGDYVIGMVTSIKPPNTQTAAETVNVLVNATGPIASKDNIPNYSALFTGRLDPATGDFYWITDDGFADQEPVIWFDYFEYMSQYHQAHLDSPTDPDFSGIDVFSMAGALQSTLGTDCP